MRSKHIILTVLIGSLLFSAAPVHARLFGNHSDNAYNDGDGTSSTGEATLTLTCYGTIKELIIKGAEFFFKAHADINLLSENTEISDLYGVDLFTLCWAVNSALDNMKMARYYYRELQFKANNAPYNQTVIAKLMAFDYDSFQEKNTLLKDVFSEVKSYLVNGNVRGIYSRTSVYFDTLIETLETIKGELYAGNVPGNTHMWNLNQVCAKVHMFGQYVTMVFDAIK